MEEQNEFHMIVTKIYFVIINQEDQKTLKAKMRERVRPKMGKIDIDYHKLHDAFFKWQTKPKMTIHGDLYYEVRAYFCSFLVTIYGTVLHIV